MTASEEMIGIIPPLIVAGAVTKMAGSMFDNGKKEKVRTRTIIKKVYVKRKKAHAKRVQKIKKTVKRYL
jgi:hypothetical protein